MKFSPKCRTKKLGMQYNILGKFCSFLNWEGLKSGLGNPWNFNPLYSNENSPSGLKQFIVHIKESQVTISQMRCPSSRILFLFQANKAEANGMLHNSTFYLSLHCLPKYSFK